MDDQRTTEPLNRRVLAPEAGLLTAWALVGSGRCGFARDLEWSLAEWPFGYWLAAQGALLANAPGEAGG